MYRVDENNVPLQEVTEDFLVKKNIKLFVLREDLIHPEISGNKWRKLKYNCVEAKEKGHSQLLTFGGAYSNHIAATAAAGKEFGFKTVGIIRGEETLPLNNTLKQASEYGMKFKYVNRGFYRNEKYNSEFLKTLKSEFGDFYLVPEGGSNPFAVKGCSEIISNISIDYDVITCACGTGGTISGIIASVDKSKEIIGFPALKGGEFLIENIQKLLHDFSIQFDYQVSKSNWILNTDFHFGGYGKITPDLVEFVTRFKQQKKIPLDLIYSGKMLFGIYQLAKTTDVFNNKTIVAIHTGGLQGNAGFEERLGIRIN